MVLGDDVTVLSLGTAEVWWKISLVVPINDWWEAGFRLTSGEKNKIIKKNKNIWGNHLSEHYCQNVVCWVINTEKLLENVFIYFGIKCITAQLSPNLLSATRTKKRWMSSSCLTHMFITYEHWSASLWILSRTQRQVLSFLTFSCEWQIKGKSLTFDPPHHMLLATLTSTWC